MSRTAIESTPADGLPGFEPVRRRRRAFYARRPLGSVRAELVRLETGRVAVRATALRGADDPAPATGRARERKPLAPAAGSWSGVRSAPWGGRSPTLGSTRGPRPSPEEILPARRAARVLDEVR